MTSLLSSQALSGGPPMKLSVRDATVELQPILMEAATIAARSVDWKRTAEKTILENPATPKDCWVYKGGHHVSCISDRADCLGQIVEVE